MFHVCVCACVRSMLWLYKTLFRVSEHTNKNLTVKIKFSLATQEDKNILPQTIFTQNIQWRIFPKL